MLISIKAYLARYFASSSRPTLRTVYTMIRRGELQAVRFAGRYYLQDLPPEKLTAFSRTVTPPPVDL